MMTEYRVATVAVDGVSGAVRRGIDLLGGIKQYVRPDAQVLIKVNMFTSLPGESGKVTHPAVVLAVARMCYDCGAHVTIVERNRPRWDLLFKGYEEIYEVAQLVTLEDADHTHKPLVGAKSLTCEVPWPDLIDACDLFINIPGLRTHALTKMSNGMKNLMGLLPGNATRLVHHHGLDGSICDINAYRPSDLVITEAIYTLEGNFPSEGSPVRTDLITVANNVVAADLVAAKLIGQDPGELFHLQEAISRGMGPASVEEIELLGDPLEPIARAMQVAPSPRLPAEHAGSYRLFLGDCCDSCLQALAGGLLAASHQPELANIEHVSIVAGHHDQYPDVGTDRVLVYGNCAYPYRHLGHYEPGCPPLSGQVMSGLAAIKPRIIHSSMCSIAWRDDPVEDVIPIVANAGYVGVELWGPHLDRYMAEGKSLSDLAELLEQHHLSVPMVSAYLDFDQDTDGSLAIVKRYLDYAQVLDVPLIRVFTGGIDGTRAPIDTWRRVVSGLRQACELAQPSGVALALETHDGHLHDSTANTLRLIRQVNAENLCVNLDIFNLYTRGEDPVRALQQLKPWVRILHLKNGISEDSVQYHGTPMRDGDMDYELFLKALLQENWGGYASVEWFGADPQGAAKTELAFLQEQLGDRLCTQMEA